MDIQTPQDTDKIRVLNDRFRQTFVGGVIVTTNAVANLHPILKARVLDEIRTFDDFDEGNDPHAEHDFGTISIEVAKFFWKIDLYDRSMEMASPNGADPSVTKRVLTIMHSSEY